MTLVTVLSRDGKRSIPLGGPYPDIEAATAGLRRVRKCAEQHDPFTRFDRAITLDVPDAAVVTLFGFEPQPILET